MKNKQSLKRKLAITTLATAFLLPTANAEEKTLELNLDHPFATYDSRANLNDSANKLTNIATDSFKLNENFAERVLESTIKTYASYLFGYMTHEAGHDGKDTKFSSELESGTLLPKAKLKIKNFSSEKDKARYFANGLNQNTYNAKTILEKTFLNNESPGIPYLANSLYLSRYNQKNITRENGSRIINDLDGWTKALSKQGFNFSKSEIKKNAQFFALLNLQNWKTFYDEINYITTGERPKSPLTFNIGNKKITPPSFSYYLGETAPFINATSFIKSPERTYSISIGKENTTTRIGGKTYNIPLSDDIKTSPSIYLNSNGGYLAGIDMEFKTGKKSSLKATIEHSKNDLMSKIKSEDGFVARASWKFKF